MAPAKFFNCACPCGCTRLTKSPKTNSEVLERRARCTTCSEPAHRKEHPSPGQKESARVITPFIPYDDEDIEIDRRIAAEQQRQILADAQKRWRESLPEKFRDSHTDHPKVAERLRRWRSGNPGTAGLVILGAVGQGKCLTGETLISNPVTGIRETLESVVQGDHVDTVYTMTHTGNITAVPISVKADTGYKKTLTVLLRSGRTLTVTPEHPFLLPDGWRRADNVRRGETVATVSKLPHPTEPVELTDEEVSLLVERLTKQGIQKETGSPSAALPEQAYQLTSRQLAQYLSFAWGRVGKIGKKKLSLRVATRETADGLQHLLLRFAIHSRVSKKEAKKTHVEWVVSLETESISRFVSLLTLTDEEERKIGKLFSYEKTYTEGLPSLSKPVRKLFREREIPLSIKDTQRGKRINIRNLAYTESLLIERWFPWLTSTDLWWDEIISVTPSGVRKVYDLSIHETQCFIANDTVVHNTFMSLGYANAAINEGLVHPSQVLFGTEAELLSSAANSTFSEVDLALRRIISPRYKMIVIDDVGRGTWIRDDMRPKVFSLVFDAAYRDNRVLVITTNLIPKDLGEYIGEGAMDRLRSMVGYDALDLTDRGMRERVTREEIQRTKQA